MAKNGRSKSVGAGYEEKTLVNKSRRDKAFDDVSVEDCEYKYTEPSFPGFMEPDLNLSRAERARVIHRIG